MQNTLTPIKRIILLGLLGPCLLQAQLIDSKSQPVAVRGANYVMRPNIVFILADDLGWHQTGVYGSTFYETPNIDKLAVEGMRFTDAYAGAHICSPTRASLMTGKSPARLHITDYISGQGKSSSNYQEPDWQKSLPLAEVTIAEALKEVGYVTGHFGKWHLNVDKKYAPGRPGDPGSQGFDDVLTTVKPGEAGPLSPFNEDWHHIRDITERALAFIENNKDKPFFCYITHNAVHDPWQEKDSLVKKYTDKPAEDGGRNNGVQAAILETLDNSVGTVMAKLTELDLDKNTLVIFFGDNGQKGPREGSPLRGAKGDLYEGGIREPLIFRLPGMIQANSVCSTAVISHDFYPTFTEAAGIHQNPADLDGLSLMPLLTQTGGVSRESIHWHFPHFRDNLPPSSAIREGKYKLIEYLEKTALKQNGNLELFDLSVDLNEANDLVGSLPEVAAALNDKLQAWKAKVGAQGLVKK